MRIALGSDHRGVEGVRALRDALERGGHEVSLHSALTDAPSDYPDAAYAVARAVADGAADRGVLVCGSGIGVCIAANKVDGIRAALVDDEVTAELAGRHNDANVLCLSGEMIPVEHLRRLVDVWLRSEFEGGRHARRVRKIAAIESGVDPTTVTEPAPSQA